jgi:hypothetical protein
LPLGYLGLGWTQSCQDLQPVTNFCLVSILRMARISSLQSTLRICTVYIDYCTVLLQKCLWLSIKCLFLLSDNHNYIILYCTKTVIRHN